MKNLEQLLENILNNKDASALTLFNETDGASSPEETAVTLRAIEVLKIADTRVLQETLEYMQER